MNDTLFRGAWDKGCTDIMYMIIEKLCEHVVTEKFKFSLRDLNSNSCVIDELCLSKIIADKKNIVTINAGYLKKHIDKMYNFSRSLKLYITYK